MSLEIAKKKDSLDSLQPYRKQFHFPKTEFGDDYLYFCGNSLGLQPKNTAHIVQQELLKWQNLGVEGHFTDPLPWVSYHKNVETPLAKLVGAIATEVVAMNALTVNLHLLLLSFYTPTANKYKIVLERNAFPSDHYAIQSQIDFYLKKGVLSKEQAQNALLYIEPDDWGVYGTDKIKDALMDPEIALVLLSGVNYQTGEVFDIQNIASYVHAQNAFFGVDLAHAIGNVGLQLHTWQIDFAVWCNYKYLNGGPGAVGGAFVHQKHLKNNELAKLQGWWSNKEENRFQMHHTLDPYQTAEAWQMSNAPVLSLAALLGSLELFDKIALKDYFYKGQELSSFLATCLKSELPHLKIVTPLEQKGCQISIYIENKDKRFIDELHSNGVIADWRNHAKGGILRVAPVPLYNSFTDCWQFITILKRVL